MVRSIFHSPGLASCRRRPLSSNVRQHRKHPAALQQSQHLSAWAEHPQRGRAASSKSVSAACQAASGSRIRARGASAVSASFSRCSAVRRFAVPSRGVGSRPSAWCCRHHGFCTVHGSAEITPRIRATVGPAARSGRCLAHATKGRASVPRSPPVPTRRSAA